MEIKRRYHGTCHIDDGTRLYGEEWTRTNGIVQRHIVTSILWFLGLNWISNAHERYRPNTLWLLGKSTYIRTREAHTAFSLRMCHLYLILLLTDASSSSFTRGSCKRNFLHNLIISFKKLCTINLGNRAKKYINRTEAFTHKKLYIFKLYSKLTCMKKSDV